MFRDERGPAGDAGNAARARAEQGSKLEQQRAAASVPVKLGDRANIDATLPYLLEPQRRSRKSVKGLTDERNEYSETPAHSRH